MNQAALELLIKLKDDATKGIGNIGKSLSNLGGIALGGGAVVATAMVGAISATTDWANKLDSLGDVLGTTGTESAGLIVAIEGVGGNAEAITGQMAKLAGGLTNAKGELGPTGIAMKDLGIQFKDANGELLPATQIIQNVADKIGNMPDGLAKTTAMTSLFGKSGKDLTDTMGALANDGLAKATQSAKDMGLALGDDTINSSIKMGKDMEKLKQTLMGLVVTIGTNLLPIIGPLVTKFVDLATIVAGRLAPVFKTLTDEVFPVLKVGIDFVVTKISDLVAGFLSLTTGSGPVATILTGIGTSIATLFAGAGGKSFLQLLGLDEETIAAITIIIANIDLVIHQKLDPIIAFITSHGEQIKSIFSLIWTAVKTAVELVLTVIGGVIKTALQLMSGDTKGALDTLKETFSKAWELIKTLVITALNLIKTELLLILDAMLAGAGTSLENLKTAFVNGINGVLDRAKGFYADFLALGTGLITKIADGIRAAPEAVWNALKDIIMSQLNNLGSFLGIKLPFGGTGGRGANSFTGSRAASGFSESGTSGFAFGGRGASVTINISANVSGGADIDALARQVAKRVRVVMS